MIDEVQVDREGLLLEKCLILYFASDDQTRNRENERRELENNLLQLASEHNIRSVTLAYELEEPNEYFMFGSSAVPAEDVHLFTFSMEGEKLILERGNTVYRSWLDMAE